MGLFVLKEGSDVGWAIIQELICIKTCDAAQPGVVNRHGLVLEIPLGRDSAR